MDNSEYFKSLTLSELLEKLELAIRHRHYCPCVCHCYDGEPCQYSSWEVKQEIMKRYE